MGKAKLKMEFISKESLRNTTFKKKKEGLVRKMHEFTTLCDVDACMIIYGPRLENGAVEPEIWPTNVDQVHKIIETYKSKKKDSASKTFGLNDFFQNRNRKAEEELSRLRQRNMEAKYPTHVKLFEHMNEGQLRAIASTLSHKAELVKSKIEGMKGKQVLMDMNTQVKGQFYPHPPPVHDTHAPHFPIYYPTIDQHQHLAHQKSMMRLLVNGEDQFGGASSSNIGPNIQCGSFKQQIFYERALPLPPYFVQPPPLPPYMVAPPQMPFFTGWENQEVVREDVVKNEMKNHRG